ncbi:Ribosomal RNA small subunit methyltransferase G [Bienertia sinuspersici]
MEVSRGYTLDMSSTTDWQTRPTIPDAMYHSFLIPRCIESTQNLIRDFCLFSDVFGMLKISIPARLEQDRTDQVDHTDQVDRTYDLEFMIRRGSPRGGTVKKMQGKWGDFVRENGVQEDDSVDFSWGNDNCLVLKILREGASGGRKRGYVDSSQADDNQKRLGWWFGGFRGFWVGFWVGSVGWGGGLKGWVSWVWGGGLKGWGGGLEGSVGFGWVSGWVQCKTSGEMEHVGSTAAVTSVPAASLK